MLESVLLRSRNGCASSSHIEMFPLSRAKDAKGRDLHSFMVYFVSHKPTNFRRSNHWRRAKRSKQIEEDLPHGFHAKKVLKQIMYNYWDCCWSQLNKPLLCHTVRLQLILIILWNVPWNVNVLCISEKCVNSLAPKLDHVPFVRFALVQTIKFCLQNCQLVQSIGVLVPFCAYLTSTISGPALYSAKVCAQIFSRIEFAFEKNERKDFRRIRVECR